MPASIDKGQATLYLSGTFLLKNSKLCAGVNPAGTDCDTTGWDPNANLLGIITNGSGGQVNSWDAITMAALSAREVPGIKVGTAVTPTYARHPLALATQALTAQATSGNRFTLGVGAGSNEAEFPAFGIPLDHRVDRFEEALRIIVPLLRDGRVDYSGKYYSARDCEITPRAVTSASVRALADGLRSVGPLFNPSMEDGALITCAPLASQVGDSGWRKACADSSASPPRSRRTTVACAR